MRLNIISIALSASIIAGCGPFQDGSEQHKAGDGNTRAEQSDPPFSQYDYSPENIELPGDQPYYLLNGQKVDEAGYCGYGYE